MNLGSVPSPVAKALAKEYAELESRFARSDWTPSELSGGRFAEALLRYLQWKQSGTFTPIGSRLNRAKVITAVLNDPALPEGIRFHVRRAADLLMDFRNKRDVAHLGAVVDVNEMDAQLVMRLAAWSFAEVIREESGLPAADVQHVLDRLSATMLPLVEEVQGKLVVVATHLKAAERCLVALYHTFPDPIDLETLRQAVRYKNRSRFRRVLKTDVAAAHVVIQNGSAVLTRKGASWVENNIDLRLQFES